MLYCLKGIHKFTDNDTFKYYIVTVTFKVVQDEM